MTNATKTAAPIPHSGGTKPKPTAAPQSPPVTKPGNTILKMARVRAVGIFYLLRIALLSRYVELDKRLSGLSAFAIFSINCSYVRS
jgi:hypothetical protein